ncbi:MAG: hypothetical protein NTW79_02365 [Candidatus Berkelbacteria bacterium]|nr:hypothetical protein [Candidatus Berkelbacteria bacterium]
MLVQKIGETISLAQKYRETTIMFLIGCGIIIATLIAWFHNRFFKKFPLTSGDRF